MINFEENKIVFRFKIFFISLVIFIVNQILKLVF